MRLVDPPQVVLVERDDRWYSGELRAWRRDREGWRAFVLYAVAPGMRYLQWVPAERVRADYLT